MNKLRFAWILVFMSVLFISPAMTVSGGKDKVDVCHITGEYDFGGGPVPVGHVITIAVPAYPAHLRHGDPEAWTIIPTLEGEEVCMAETNANLCPGWTAEQLALVGSYGFIYVSDDYYRTKDEDAGWFIERLSDSEEEDNHAAFVQITKETCNNPSKGDCTLGEVKFSAWYGNSETYADIVTNDITEEQYAACKQEILDHVMPVPSCPCWTSDDFGAWSVSLNAYADTTACSDEGYHVSIMGQTHDGTNYKYMTVGVNMDLGSLMCNIYDELGGSVASTTSYDLTQTEYDACEGYITDLQGSVCP